MDTGKPQRPKSRKPPTRGTGHRRKWLDELEAEMKLRSKRATELAESTLAAAAKAFASDPNVDRARFLAALEILASGTVARGSAAETALREHVEPVIERALKHGGVDPDSFSKVAAERLGLPDDAWIGGPMLVAATMSGALAEVD